MKRNLVLLVSSLALAAFAFAGCGGGEKTTETKTKTEKQGTEADGSADNKRAKQLFVGTCGSCHVLAAAGTKGTAGPSLDDKEYTPARVEKQIAEGGETMQAGYFKGKDAKDVAAYVAEVAGK